MLSNSAQLDKREALSDARPIEASSQAQQPPIVYAVPVDAGTGQVLNANPAPPQALPVQTYVIDSRGPLVRPVGVAPQATVVTLVQTTGFGSSPARIMCPFCGADVVTGVRTTPSIAAHLWALGLCVFGCWPCCLVPYFVNDCQSHIHVCPNCNHEVGFHGL